ADRNRSHWSTSKTPSYTKSVSWQHHPQGQCQQSQSRYADPL
ncbi:transposase, partial [Escherichia coli]